MSLFTKAGTFNLTTGGATTTQSISGLGFQPKLLILHCNGMISTTDLAVDTTSDEKSSIGFAASPTDRRVVAGRSNIGVSPSVDFSGMRDDALLAIITNGTTWEALIDLQSFDADGFTLIVDAGPAAAGYTVNYLAIGGDEITNAVTGMLTVPNSTGPQAITGLGFQPSMLVFLAITNGGGTPPFIVSDNAITHGFASANWTPNQVVTASHSQNGQAAANTTTYGREDRCIAVLTTSGAAVDGEAQLASFDSGGFTLDWLSAVATANVRVFYLAIKGGAHLVGSYQTAANTTPATIEPPSNFQIKGGWIVSAGNQAQTASPAGTWDDETGFFDENLAFATFLTKMANAANPTQGELGYSNTLVIYHLNNAGAVIREETLDSITPLGVVSRCSVNTNAVSFYNMYWWIGTEEWRRVGQWQAK